MRRMTIHIIAAARPNFMKVAPLFHALRIEPWCRPIIVHTGQHYDANMSDAFFSDLGLPAPEYHLGIGSGTHAEQTAGVMVAYEKILFSAPPNLVIVVGDVNSTIACTLAAKKLCFAVAHLEAGLRSRDWTMPEEINRILTDSIADILWTPSEDADENLRGEGVSSERITRVGNIMIDSYELLRPRIEAEATRQTFGLDAREYGVVTLHRPANVDDPKILSALVATLKEVARTVPLVFALHPRTRKNLANCGLLDSLQNSPGLHVTEPLSYIPFMSLVREAKLVITDSGGIQEETTYLGIPCLTLRSTTERPITISRGTNRLVTMDALAGMISRIAIGDWPKARCPSLWDGKTAGRIAVDLKRRYLERELI